MQELFTLRPAGYTLTAYPNPFNPETRIHFTLTKPGRISLRVFDVLGRQVADLGTVPRHAGAHDTVWNTAGIAASAYFVRLSGPEGELTTKLVLMK